MSNTSRRKPIVLTIYGFYPDGQLHRALSRVDELKAGYSFLRPNFRLPSQVLVADWKHKALMQFVLPSNWQRRALYVIEPHSVYISAQVWQCILHQFIEAHSGSVRHLSIEGGHVSKNEPRWVIRQVTVYSNKLSTYL